MLLRAAAKRQPLHGPPRLRQDPLRGTSSVTKRIIAGAALAIMAAACLPAQTAEGGGIFAPIPKVTGPAPHFADGTPDLSGVWMGGGSNSGDITKALKAGDSVSMTPWAEKSDCRPRAAHAARRTDGIYLPGE